MAKIDIVVPCYNYGRFFRPAFFSILKESIQDLRVLIIDDASSDDTLAGARKRADADPRSLHHFAFAELGVTSKPTTRASHGPPPATSCFYRPTTCWSLVRSSKLRRFWMQIQTWCSLMVAALNEMTVLRF